MAIIAWDDGVENTRKEGKRKKIDNLSVSEKVITERSCANFSRNLIDCDVMNDSVKRKSTA